MGSWISSWVAEGENAYPDDAIPFPMYDDLVESLESSPVVMKNGYPYFVHPLTDGVPHMDPKVLKEVLAWMYDICDFDCDYLVAPEAMGIPLAVPISLEKGIPYTVVRKKIYGLPGEVVFDQKTGYSGNRMSLNGLKKGDRVVIIDDVISTGGTLVALIEAIRSTGAEIVDILIPVEKNDGKDLVLEKTGLRVKTLVKVSVVNGKVRCSIR